MLGWSALALERSAVAIVCRGHAGNIGDVFGQRLLAIHREVWERLIGVVLSSEFCRRGSEVCEIRRCPPIAHAPVGVEGAALCIEGMADLVADDGADRAIVRSGRCRGIIERRLQDRGREVKRILQWQVDSVHRLRRHRPFLAIDGLSDARDVGVVIEQPATPAVAGDIIRLHLVAGIIAPAFCVADAYGKRVELGNGFRLGCRRHPRQGAKPLAIGGNDVCNQSFCLGLGLW